MVWSTKQKKKTLVIQTFACFNVHMCFHISKMQTFPLFFLLTLWFLFSSIFPSFSICLLLERIKCSQRMKLETSCFKCCLGWLLYINMVRSFPWSSFYSFNSRLTCSLSVWVYMIFKKSCGPWVDQKYYIAHACVCAMFSIAKRYVLVFS